MASGPLWEAAVALNSAAGDPFDIKNQIKDMNGRDGWSSSAFTLEDLPSNWMGAGFGAGLNGTGDVGDSLLQIVNQMGQLFKDCGAVEYDPVLNEEAKRHETNAKTHRFFGGESFNFSRFPKKGINHKCVCDENNNPLKPRPFGL